MATYSKRVEMEESEGHPFALPAKQERSQRSLERVLNAAETVLRSGGLEDFSIARVSAESGISVGGIYARVKGKQELLQLIKGEMIGRVSAANLRAINRGQTTVDAILDDFVDSLTEGFANDERLHRSLFSAGFEYVSLHMLGERHRRENLAALATRLIGADARLATCTPAAIDFGTDMIAGVVVARLTRPGADAIEWQPLRAHLKFAAKAYFQRLIDEAGPRRGHGSLGAVAAAAASTAGEGKMT